MPYSKYLLAWVLAAAQGDIAVMLFMGHSDIHRYVCIGRTPSTGPNAAVYSIFSVSREIGKCIGEHLLPHASSRFDITSCIITANLTKLDRPEGLLH